MWKSWRNLTKENGEDRRETEGDGEGFCKGGYEKKRIRDQEKQHLKILSKLRS